jgi:hypothetical protein
VVGTVEKLADGSRSLLRRPRGSAWQGASLCNSEALVLLSAMRGRTSASPLGQGELLVASSSPHSCRARPSAATVMMTLRWRGEATTRMTPTCRSSPLPRWVRRRSTTAPVRIFIGGDTTLPRLPPLDEVVVSIALGDLAFFVLHLARSAPPLRCHLVPVEYRLL